MQFRAISMFLFTDDSIILQTGWSFLSFIDRITLAEEKLLQLRRCAVEKRAKSRNWEALRKWSTNQTTFPSFSQNADFSAGTPNGSLRIRKVCSYLRWSGGRDMSLDIRTRETFRKYSAASEPSNPSERKTPPEMFWFGRVGGYPLENSRGRGHHLAKLQVPASHRSRVRIPLEN